MGGMMDFSFPREMCCIEGSWADRILRTCEAYHNQHAHMMEMDNDVSLFNTE